MSDKILKVTLAARVQPDLKESIYEEAANNKVTPSSYVESILFKRDLLLNGFLEDNPDELARLEGAIEEVTAELEATKLTLDEWQADDETPELKATIENLEAEREELQAQLDEMLIERDEVIETYHKLQSENTDLKEQLNEVEEMPFSTGQDDDEFEEGLADEDIIENDPNPTDEINKELEALQVTNDSLQSQVKQLTKQLAASASPKEYKGLNKAINTLKSKNEGLESKLLIITTEKEELAEKCTSLENCAISFSTEEKEELDAYLKELSTRYPDLSINEIILAGISSAIANEKSTFWITTIKKYKKDKESAAAWAEFEAAFSGKLEEAGREEVVVLEEATIEE